MAKKKKRAPSPMKLFDEKPVDEKPVDEKPVDEKKDVAPLNWRQRRLKGA